MPGPAGALGELLAGLVLGPILHDPHLQEQIFQLAEIGVILLMFIAGLEIEVSELLASFKVAPIAGVLGMIVPLLLGAALAWYWPERL